MSKSRKDDHIRLALESKQTINDFDHIHLMHQNLSNLKIDDIDLESEFLGHKVSYPFYINGMTGGTKTAQQINEKLAMIAQKFSIPMMSGSQSITFKDASTIDSFKIIKERFSGIKIANLSANAKVSQALEAVEMIDAKGLAIHLNVLQELSMEEGDRNFRGWLENIEKIKRVVNVPILIKEVGFGMPISDTEKLAKLGFKYIDISGSGGTHFGHIEAKRANTSYLFETFGASTVTSIINHQVLKETYGIKIYASGGIRHAGDIVKSLILGADMVGLSKWFLELTKLEITEAYKQVENLILDLKLMMLALGVKLIAELRKVSYNR